MFQKMSFLPPPLDGFLIELLPPLQSLWKFQLSIYITDMFSILITHHYFYVRESVKLHTCNDCTDDW